jgi:hypothetical protein
MALEWPRNAKERKGRQRNASNAFLCVPWPSLAFFGVLWRSSKFISANPYSIELFFELQEPRLQAEHACTVTFPIQRHCFFFFFGDNSFHPFFDFFAFSRIRRVATHSSFPQHYTLLIMSTLHTLTLLNPVALSSGPAAAVSMPDG